VTYAKADKYTSQIKDNLAKLEWITFDASRNVSFVYLVASFLSNAVQIARHLLTSIEMKYIFTIIVALLFCSVGYSQLSINNLEQGKTGGYYIHWCWHKEDILTRTFILRVITMTLLCRM